MRTEVSDRVLDLAATAIRAADALLITAGAGMGLGIAMGAAEGIRRIRERL